MSKEKGDRWERAYRRVLSATDRDTFDKADRFDIAEFELVRPFTAVRMPSSGSAIDVDLPDLHIWFNPDSGVVRQYAAEVKATADSVHFSKNGGDAGIPALRRYANAVGATPIAIIHIDYTGDFVVHVDELVENAKSHSFTSTRDVDDDTRTFSDWVRNPLMV